MYLSFITVTPGMRFTVSAASRSRDLTICSPDTPLAAFWTWGRALRLMDGPDEVHLRTVARHELAQARGALGASAAYFTTPEQLRAPPHLSA